jgi:hypothetical protein
MSSKERGTEHTSIERRVAGNQRLTEPVTADMDSTQSFLTRVAFVAAIFLLALLIAYMTH